MSDPSAAALKGEEKVEREFEPRCVAYSANGKAKDSSENKESKARQELITQVIKETLRIRQRPDSHRNDRVNGFELNASTVFLMKEGKKVAESSTLSSEGEDHAEILASSDVMKIEFRGRRGSESRHNFIRSHVDRLRGSVYELIVFSERPLCQNQGNKECTCHQFFKELHDNGVQVSVYYVIPPQLHREIDGSEGDSARQCEDATLAMLLPCAMRTLRDSELIVNPLQRCITGSIKHGPLPINPRQFPRVPLVIKLHESPVRYCGKTGQDLPLCRIATFKSRERRLGFEGMSINCDEPCSVFYQDFNVKTEREIASEESERDRERDRDRDSDGGGQRDSRYSQRPSRPGGAGGYGSFDERGAREGDRERDRGRDRIRDHERQERNTMGMEVEREVVPPGAPKEAKAASAVSDSVAREEASREAAQREKKILADRQQNRREEDRKQRELEAERKAEEERRKERDKDKGKDKDDRSGRKQWW